MIRCSVVVLGAALMACPGARAQCLVTENPERRSSAGEGPGMSRKPG